MHEALQYCFVIKHSVLYNVGDEMFEEVEKVEDKKTATGDRTTRLTYADGDRPLGVHKSEKRQPPAFGWRQKREEKRRADVERPVDGVFPSEEGASRSATANRRGIIFKKLYYNSIVQQKSKQAHFLRLPSVKVKLAENRPSVLRRAKSPSRINEQGTKQSDFID